MQTKVVKSNAPNAIKQAVDVLSKGGVLAFPTDTVYGLGAIAFNEEGVQRLFSVKERSEIKAIAVLISDVEELDQVTPEPSKDMLRLAKKFWPGPLTLVVRREPKIPQMLSSDLTIGVRIPDHPFALELLAATGPMGVTSANLSGGGNANNAEEVLAQLDGRIDLILDGGDTPGGVPSTVLDLTPPNPTIMRPGPISALDVELSLL